MPFNIMQFYMTHQLHMNLGRACLCATEKYIFSFFYSYSNLARALLLTFQMKVTHAAAIIFPSQQQGLLNALVVGWQHLLYMSIFQRNLTQVGIRARVFEVKCIFLNLFIDFLLKFEIERCACIDFDIFILAFDQICFHACKYYR